MKEESLKRQPLVILGTGSFAPEIADLVEETDEYEVVAFVESKYREKTRQTLDGKPIIWIDEAAKISSTHQAVCALASTFRRSFVERASKLGFSFATIIHPNASFSKKSSIGNGSILSAGTIIGANTVLGQHVMINRGSLFGHHVNIGDFATISPGVNIAASVTVGEGTYVGMGAIILDRLTIGAHAVIGAGAVVTRDVPDCVQVMGIPAKITKVNIEGR